MAYRKPGPPAWLVILIAGLVVFGGYFIYAGIRNYMAGSLQGAFIAQTTRSAGATPSFDPNMTPTLDLRFTLAPSRTPVPACQDFVVIVPEAIIRECASTNCAIKDVRHDGDVVCVLERDYEQAEWYIIDLDDSRFFTDLAYMHESLLRAVNPTPTPTITPSPAPTNTPTEGVTLPPGVSPTPTPTESGVRFPTITPTPMPTSPPEISA
jgi:hypothetical protein